MITADTSVGGVDGGTFYKFQLTDGGGVIILTVTSDRYKMIKEIVYVKER